MQHATCLIRKRHSMLLRNLQCGHIFWGHSVASHSNLLVNTGRSK